jgi:transcriptional regulator with XRE-family HTH domain
MELISPIKLNIVKKLKEDNSYRKRFFRRRTQDDIAMSIRSLREKRQMRQVDLAVESKMKQSAVSRIEQAEYSAWSLTTLFRIADALDARLRVIIDPIESVIEDYEREEKIIIKEHEPDMTAVSSIASANDLEFTALPFITEQTITLRNKNMGKAISN